MTRFILAASLAALASGALSLGSASPSTSTGAPPPELTQFANEWPTHNLNLSSTRATTASSINSTNVARLTPSGGSGSKARERSGSSRAIRSSSATRSNSRT
jgi:hypothetical protein